MNSCERSFRVWEWEELQDPGNSSRETEGKRKLVCRFIAEKRQTE